MMLARAAADFYWMGRYLERTEHTARLLEYQLPRLVDTLAEEVALGWQVIYRALEQDPPPAPANADEAEAFLIADAYTLAARLIEDDSHPDSVISCWTMARENAKQLRPWLPVRVWTCLNRGYFRIQEADFSESWKRDPSSVAGEAIDGLRLLAGVVSGTMSRDDAWRFMELGRFVERLQQQVGLLMAWDRLGQPAAGGPALSWESLLRVSGAYEFFCRTYSMRIRRETALRFLMRHPELPRSVRYAVARIGEMLSGIDPGGARYPLAAPHRMNLRLAAAIEADDNALHAVRKNAKALHDVIMATYVEYPVEKGLPS